MSTALNILIAHHYGSMGGAPAICVGANGLPTDCRWKASRRSGANGAGVQHLVHLADLIDQDYAPDRREKAQLAAVRHHVTSLLAFTDAALEPASEFVRGRRHALREIAQVLDIGGVKL